MYSRKTAIERASNFIKECLESKIPLEKVILFGSYAKKKQQEFSDIDLALVSRQFTKNFLENNRMTSRINIRYPEIEVHHFRNEDFEKGNPFVDEIIKTGYLLFEVSSTEA
jgi:predicted nucleotidyltransferase